MHKHVIINVFVGSLGLLDQFTKPYSNYLHTNETLQPKNTFISGNL